MIKEIWLPVTGYELLYEVSNHGNIQRILPNGSKRLLKIIKAMNGYPRIGLCERGKLKLFSVHRLVAEAFIGIPEGMVVNHKNGVPMDCNLLNLEVCTRSENEQHKMHVLKKVPRPHAKLTLEQVSEIRLALKAGTRGKLIAEKYNVRANTISSIKTGLTWRIPY
jgi:hypothetical protein